jgi:hypothetical protein
MVSHRSSLVDLAGCLRQERLTLPALVCQLGLMCLALAVKLTDSSCSKIDFCVQISVWIVSVTHSGYVLEPPDQRARDFLVPITLKWLFPKHAHKLFGEMLVST